MLVKTLLYFIGFFCVITTILSTLKSEIWWIRIWDFPRIQILVLSILSAGFFIGFYRLDGPAKTFIFLMAGVIIYQGFMIFPYTTFHGFQTKRNRDSHPTDDSVSVYVTNVYMNNREAAKCLAEIEKANPDLILAVETDEWWNKALKSLEQEYPYTIKAPLSNTYGLLFYSRFELIDPEVKYLIQKDIPSIKTKVKLKSGKVFRFYGLHPTPPAPRESDSSLPRDAELVVVAKDSKKEKLPVVVAGDLNDVAWSRTTHLFQKISGLLDPRVGRGMYSTFNSKYPGLRWPLDHLFHSNHFQLIDIQRMKHIGSDHFPIFVKLALVPQEKHKQEKPHATLDEKKEADKKVEKAQ